MLVSPRRANAADLHTQAASADSQAGIIQIKLAQLKAEFAGLPKRQAELKSIKKQLPPGADIPAFVRTLQSVADKTGVSLDSITPGTPAVVGGPGAATTASTGSVVAVPMGVTVSGDYFEASLFLKNLQTKIERSYLVNGINLAPATVATSTAAGTETATATVTATATPSASGTATASATPTATSTGTASVATLEGDVTMTLTGSVFVLLDGTSTFDDVAKDAKTAAKAAPTS
jgi:Tfp pilus assembly protein PilO